MAISEMAQSIITTSTSPLYKTVPTAITTAISHPRPTFANVRVKRGLLANVAENRCHGILVCDAMLTEERHGSLLVRVTSFADHLPFLRLLLLPDSNCRHFFGDWRGRILHFVAGKCGGDHQKGEGHDTEKTHYVNRKLHPPREAFVPVSQLASRGGTKSLRPNIRVRVMPSVVCDGAPHKHRSHQRNP